MPSVRLATGKQSGGHPPLAPHGSEEGVHVPRELVQERASLFPSDPRAALVLLNEARCRAIQGVFGVRRDQVNVMTFIAAMTLTEVVHTRAHRVRRGLRGPTRAEVIVGDWLLNALGQGIAGPASREIRFFPALIGTAAVGTFGARVLRRGAHDTKAASHRLRLSFSHLVGPQTAN